MTDTLPEPLRRMEAASTSGYVSQATAVEQSRAVAEVQAAVIVAQQRPRDIGHARALMQDSCSQMGLAERAFYRYPRGGETVSGESIHLARELARCFQNVQYSVDELRRDDVKGESEMQAWAWDLETNVRSSIKFIVPHRRDTKGGSKPLVDLRDVYENNANMGARRLREQIFAVLPPQFIEEAKDECYKTLQRGDDKPVEERVAGAIAVFDEMGISKGMLEQKLGRPADQWTPFDLAQLTVTRKSLRRGEVTVADEFPQVLVTTDEITTPPAAAPPPAAVPADEAEGPSQNESGAPPASDPVTAPEPASGDLEAELRAAVKAKLGMTITKLTKHYGVGTLDQLAADEALAMEAFNWIDTQ